MTLIDNLPIQKKMLILVATLLLLQMLTSGFGAFKIQTISEEFNTIQQEALPLTELNADITIKQLESEILLERLLRLASITSSAETINALHQKMRVLSSDIEQQLSQADTLLQTALTHPLNDILKTEMIALKDRVSNIKQEHQQFEQLVANLITAIEQKHPVQPQHIITFEQSEQLINQHLKDMLVDIERMAEHTIEKVHQDEQSALSNLLIFSVLSLLIGLFLSRRLADKITRPIYALINTLTTMSKDNNLTLRMDDNRQDEMGQLATTFNQFIATVQQLIHNIDNASHQLASAAEETSTVIQLTSNDIDDQKNGTIQVASAINEMTASVQEVAFNAEQASQAANSGGSDANNGKGVVQDMVYAIDELAQEISSSADVITQVKTSSEDIGSVLDVIKNIAEQTNLLALNAAIEAARAGEQGRGFAVVADEVRSLAQKTQGSTHEIEALIGALQHNSDNAVDSMKKNQSGIQSLIDKAHSATASLNAITGSVHTITEMNIQIASAAEQQSHVVSDINQNITAIQQVSENTAVGAKQITGASEEIAQLSAQLRLMVQRFKAA